MSGRDDKAQRYIALLDTARANGAWDELPELIRKVTKHAPQRKCLISTATLEHAVIRHICAGDSRPAPSGDGAPISEANLTHVADSLRSNDQESDDAIQGRSALLWARWAGPDASKSIDPEDWTTEEYSSSHTNSLWTSICLVKTAYMKGMILSRGGNEVEANATYRSAIPYLNSIRPVVTSTPQLLYWTQQLSAQLALNESRCSKGLRSAPGERMTLQAFRQWAMLSSRSRDVPSKTYGYVGPQASKIEVSKAYYDYLSTALQSGNLPTENYSSTSPLEQVNELRRIEASYESELLRTTQFPKATETNKSVEDWVEQVIRNWKVLCGPRWSEADLGEGGRNSLGRSVLDILYRAATKTFHSTIILRRLFQVHKSLTDFDLAYRALDTYLELNDREKAKAAKSEESQNRQDNDDAVLETISEGIESLCSFGRHSEAEKAFELCQRLEGMLDEIGEPHHPPALGNGRLNGVTEDSEPAEHGLSPQILQVVQRALGIGKAQWAKWTPFTETRSILQSEAVRHLKTAISQPIANESKVQSIYALGLLLAETREIDKAIESIKMALELEVPPSHTPTRALERELIPLWHLLALLLTSRQEFETAGQSCAAAFEQFSSSGVLFGTGPGRSTENKKLTEKVADGGLVDDMECNELQRIIEIRITELALTELAEGPEHAVNRSNDLLALYTRLFGHLDVTAEEKPIPKAVEPPKSSAGTVKSFRGSLFGRRKFAPPSEVFSEKTNGVTLIRTDTTRPTTQATQAPTIHVTDEDTKHSTHRHRVFRRPEEKPRNEKWHSSHSNSKLARSGSGDRNAANSVSNISSQRQSFETSREAPRSSIGTMETARPHLDTIKSVYEIPTASPTSAEHGANPEANRPSKDVAPNLASNEKVPLPDSHDDQSLAQDVRLPMINPNSTTTSPVPRFPKATAQKHALVVLTKVWLVIAKLYRRCSMFEDCREATDEAAKSALKIESLIASVESSARAFADPGWGGGGKSSDEVWADVLCERGDLLLTIAKTRQEKDAEADNEGIREAVEQYEQCLMCYADHPGGIVGLSNLLLDFYERKVELGRKVDDGRPKQKDVVKEEASKTRRPAIRTSDTTTSNATFESQTPPSNAASGGSTEDDLRKTPENLNRLAARDRAYGLLSTLAKLGSSWDNSEAWFALARAHELGGEIEKAKDILWWCVELEDTRPIRHWKNLGCGGYVL